MDLGFIRECKNDADMESPLVAGHIGIKKESISVLLFLCNEKTSARFIDTVLSIATGDHAILLNYGFF
jgi:hypothetical protein